eukprot:431356-Pleurochrysis_carterae.AAC.1
MLACTPPSCINTDDIVLAAVGTDRIVALLRAWHTVTRRVGLTMAIPEKRQDLYALCARLGVHPQRLQVPPLVAAFLGPLAPEHGAFNFDLLPVEKYG